MPLKTRLIHDATICLVETTSGGSSPHTGRRLYVVGPARSDLHILSVPPSDMFTYEVNAMEGKTFDKIQYAPKRGCPYKGRLVTVGNEKQCPEPSQRTHLVHVIREEVYEVAVSASNDREACDEAIETLNQEEDLEGYYLSTRSTTAEIRSHLT